MIKLTSKFLLATSSVYYLLSLNAMAMDLTLDQKGDFRAAPRAAPLPAAARASAWNADAMVGAVSAAAAAGGGADNVRLEIVSGAAVSHATPMSMAPRAVAADREAGSVSVGVVVTVAPPVMTDPDDLSYQLPKVPVNTFNGILSLANSWADFQFLGQHMQDIKQKFGKGIDLPVTDYNRVKKNFEDLNQQMATIEGGVKGRKTPFSEFAGNLLEVMELQEKVQQIKEPILSLWRQLHDLNKSKPGYQPMTSLRDEGEFYSPPEATPIATVASQLKKLQDFEEQVKVIKTKLKQHVVEESDLPKLGSLKTSVESTQKAIDELLKKNSTLILLGNSREVSDLMQDLRSGVVILRRCINNIQTEVKSKGTVVSAAPAAAAGGGAAASFPLPAGAASGSAVPYEVPLSSTAVRAWDAEAMPMFAAARAAASDQDAAGASVSAVAAAGDAHHWEPMYTPTAMPVIASRADEDAAATAVVAREHTPVVAGAKK